MAGDMPGSSVGPSANDHSDGADLSAADSVGAGQPPWVRRQFPRQVTWGRRRLDPRSPRGFWLTFTVFAGALAAWAFGGITQDVVGHNEAALLDPHITAWAVAHRTGWLTSVMKVVTWLGSAAVIIPLAAIVGVYFVMRRHRWQPLALLAAALAGAIGLYDIIKPLVGRPRPPPTIWIGHFSGAAFPSGHATQSVACYATLAVILGTGRSARAKTVLWSTAALVALAVGASRVYLGAHWLTDVLGGYTLGASWVAAVIIVMTTASSPRTGEAKLADPGSGSRRRAKRDTR